MGAVAAFIEPIADLPPGIFSVHRIEGLSPDQLKERLKESTFELEKARALADKSAASKTVELAAEKDVLESVFV